jgi:hypothetical protein
MISFIIYTLIAFLSTELCQWFFPFEWLKNNPKLRRVYSLYSGVCWAVLIIMSRDTSFT